MPAITKAKKLHKVCAIKELVVWNSWDLKPFDLLNSLALGCYQPSPEVYSYDNLSPS